MHLCFFFLNFGKQLFRGKFCFPAKFFCFEIWTQLWGKKLLGSFSKLIGKALVQFELNELEVKQLFASVD